tara:strand:- start:525 stop:845 length:321 start_codon:yes stop_codon:yes gene_type:complete
MTTTGKDDVTRFLSSSSGKAFLFGSAMWLVWLIWVLGTLLQTGDMVSLTGWTVMFGTVLLNSTVVVLSVWNVKRSLSQKLAHKLWVAGLGALAVLSLTLYGTVLFF